MATAPRSTVPLCSVSGGSSASRRRWQRRVRHRLAGLRPSRQEHEIDRLVDLAFDRLQRHHAILHDRRRDPAGHTHAVGALPRQIETGLEPRQRQQRPPTLAIASRVASSAHEIDVPAGLRDIGDRTGTLQAAAADSCATCCALRSVIGSLHDGATVSGIGKIKLRRASASASCAASRAARLAHIGSQPPGAQRRLRHAEHVARHRRLERSRVAVIERALVGLGAAVERLRHPPHLLRHRRSPTPISRKLSSMSWQNRSNSSLADRRPCAAGISRQPPQHQHQMQHDHVEAGRHRVRHPITTIERRGSRLRHDHAIEGVDVGVSPGAAEGERIS